MRRIANRDIIKPTPEMLREITDMQEFERTKIGMDLHDDIGNQLFCIHMDLSIFEKIIPDEHKKEFSLVQQRLTQAMDSVHAISHGLVPMTLNKIGLSGKVPLSKREHEIVRLTCEELSLKEIANKLFISEHTVRNHRVNIMKKIGVKNVVGLVKYGFEANQGSRIE